MKTMAAPVGDCHAFKSDGNTEPLDNAKDNRSVAGVLGDFLAALLTFFFQLLQVGNDNGQQLDDNRGTDVWHDPQGKYGQLLHAPPENMLKTPKMVPSMESKKDFQGSAVDSRRRDVHPDSVDEQQRRV
jgi:hypothetical protein